MTGEEFLELLKKYQLIVRFTARVEDWDGYFDENMIAEAVAYNLIELDVVEVVFYTKDFDDHNTKVEKCTYWDSNGNATWSARQANCHPETKGWKESVYISMEDQCPFEVIKMVEREPPVEPDLAEYETSAQFTDELSNITDAINSDRMSAWMKLTDNNYTTNTRAKLRRVRTAIRELWEELEKAE